MRTSLRFTALDSSHFPSIFANERNTERNPLTRHVLSCTNSVAPRSSTWWRLIMLTFVIVSYAPHVRMRSCCQARMQRTETSAGHLLCLWRFSDSSRFIINPVSHQQHENCKTGARTQEKKRINANFLPINMKLLRYFIYRITAHKWTNVILTFYGGRRFISF